MTDERPSAVGRPPSPGNRRAASSQNRKPRTIRTPLPEISPRELHSIERGRTGHGHHPDRCTMPCPLGPPGAGRGGGAAAAALAKPPEQADVVVEGEGEVVG